MRRASGKWANETSCLSLQAYDWLAHLLNLPHGDFFFFFLFEARPQPKVKHEARGKGAAFSLAANLDALHEEHAQSTKRHSSGTAFARRGAEAGQMG